MFRALCYLCLLLALTACGLSQKSTQYPENALGDGYMWLKLADIHTDYGDVITVTWFQDPSRSTCQRFVHVRINDEKPIQACDIAQPVEMVVYGDAISRRNQARVLQATNVPEPDGQEIMRVALQLLE